MRFHRKDFRDLGIGLLFLLPNLLGFLTFTLVPLVISLVMAFTDWNLEMHNIFQEQPVRFVGFANFIRLFSDPDFGTFLGNTLFLMMGIPFGIMGSLGAALLLNHDFSRTSKGKKVYWVVLATVILTVSSCLPVMVGLNATAMTLLLCSLAGTILISGAIGGQGVYRTLFYFPSFTSGVATFIVWKKMYSPENGPINNAIRPLLHHINPFFANLTEPYARGVAGALLVLVAIIYLLTLRRRLKLWKNGECGHLSLGIGCALTITPMLLSGVWSHLPFGQILGVSSALLGIGIIFARFLKGRDYKAVADYGMTDAIILDGLVMIGLFILLGLSNAIPSLVAAAARPGGLSAPNWLQDYNWAKPALMIMGFWGAIGSNNMLLYLAGLSKIPPELYEAANMDGASPLQLFWHVTWPQLSSITFFILIMSVMGGLQGGFEMARTMTQGGPAGSTTTLSYYIYTQGFATGRLGYASAVSWTLFVLVFIVTLFNWKFGNRYTND